MGFDSLVGARGAERWTVVPRSSGLISLLFRFVAHRELWGELHPTHAPAVTTEGGAKRVRTARFQLVASRQEAMACCQLGCNPQSEVSTLPGQLYMEYCRESIRKKGGFEKVSFGGPFM